jgi:hypothetical protein
MTPICTGIFKNPAGGMIQPIRVASIRWKIRDRQRYQVTTKHTKETRYRI